MWFVWLVLVLVVLVVVVVLWNEIKLRRRAAVEVPEGLTGVEARQAKREKVAQLRHLGSKGPASARY